MWAHFRHDRWRGENTKKTKIQILYLNNTTIIPGKINVKNSRFENLNINSVASVREDIHEGSVSENSYR